MIMKKNLLTFCTFFCISAYSLSAQAIENDYSQLRELNGKIYASSETTYCILNKDSYYTWNCRKCGATNAQGSNRCSKCGDSR